MKKNNAQNGGRPAQGAPVSYASAWFHFLLILCLIVAWYFPAKIILTRVMYPRIEPGPRDAKAFIALAYRGVSDKETEVNKAQFRNHLRKLTEKGYKPITLTDVRNLLLEGEPVPRKAVLLTFDHSRKTSYFQCNSILRRMGWNAVMFLWTQPVEERDPASVLWPYSRSMAKSRIWEIGAQSHGGYLKVPSDPSGTESHFMTTYKWLDDKNRRETINEFQERIARDHDTCIELINDKIGVEPIAYAYPYGDYGQFEREAKEIRRINMAVVGQKYDLGFISGKFGVNTEVSDPKRLNRMVVEPDWTGDDLVARLDVSLPQTDDVTIEAGDTSAWVVDWGFMRKEEKHIELRAANEGEESAGRISFGAMEQHTGARIWLAGSDMRDDFHSRVKFRLIKGQIGVFVRGTPDEERLVYLGIDTDGNIWLRQKHVGMDPFTIASSKVRFDPEADHVLDVFVRDNIFGASLDGRNIFSERTRLRGVPKPGMLGLSVWHPKAGEAKAEVADVEVSGQKLVLATWDFNERNTPYYIKWIHGNGFRLTELSPSWMSVRPGGYLQVIQGEMGMFRTLADIYNLDLTPKVTVEEGEYLSLLVPNKLAKDATDMGADGVYLDLEGLKGVSIPRIRKWLAGMQETLADAGLSLLVRPPDTLDDVNSIHSILAVVPGIQIAMAANTPESEEVGRSDVDPVEVETVEEPDSEQAKPFQYLIDPAASSGEFARQERMLELREDGRSAFNAGRYERAIEAWSAWAEMDPTDPIPPMLIGDAYARLDENEKALAFYKASLDLDPGRISLAMKYAALLESAGREDEAVRLVNLYALLFPENPEVISAQADWLVRHNRPVEGYKLVEQALALNPGSMDITITALRLAPGREDKIRHMTHLVELADRPEAYAQLADAIAQYDLFSMPESHILTELVRKILNSQDVAPEIAASFERYKMRTTPVVDTFSDGTLSDDWIVSSGVVMSERLGEVRFQVNPMHTEGTLRLAGTERLRDGWIETDVRGVAGEFWLIGRRGPGNYVRFGIDESNNLHIQAWRDGRRVSNKTRPWSMLTKRTKLRLEIRGNGARGYVDGDPAFGAPLAMPRNVGLGSWGLAVYSPRIGRASAVMEYLSAGPLPVAIALLPPLPSEDKEMTDLMLRLKSEARYLSAISPQWFEMEADGSLTDNFGKNDDVINILARYHGIRLLPVVRMSVGAPLPTDLLSSLAAEHKFDGYVLMFGVMPPNDWFERMAQTGELASLELLAVALDESTGSAEVRGLGAGAGLIPTEGSGSTEISLRHWFDKVTGAHRPLESLPAAQHSIILP